MVCDNILLYIMNSSERTSTTEKRPVSAPSSSTIAEVTDRSSVRGYVSKKFLNKAAYVRLHAELAAARPEFELLVERTGSEEDSWVEYGRELLDMAETALSRGAIEEAWRHLHTAKRFEIYGLEIFDKKNKEEGQRSDLEIRAAVIREEALDTLDGWRRRTVVDLLCDENETLKEVISGPELRAASRLLHEQYESVYLLRSERQRQFNQLALLGVLSGLFLFVLTLIDWLWEGSTGLSGLVADFLETPFNSEEIALTDPGFAVFVTIAGVMGAALFGMRSLRKQSLSTKIPQQISQLTVTSARGVIGAISALLFYFVLRTPLVQDGTILAEGVITAPMMVVVGFAAGYTERMVPSVVAKVASITESDKSDESKGQG